MATARDVAYAVLQRGLGLADVEDAPCGEELGDTHTDNYVYIICIYIYDICICVCICICIHFIKNIAFTYVYHNPSLLNLLWEIEIGIWDSKCVASSFILQKSMHELHAVVLEMQAQNITKHVSPRFPTAALYCTWSNQWSECFAHHNTQHTISQCLVNPSVARQQVLVPDWLFQDRRFSWTNLAYLGHHWQSILQCGAAESWMVRWVIGSPVLEGIGRAGFHYETQITKASAS